VITGLKDLKGPPDYEVIELGTLSVSVDAKVEIWLDNLRLKMKEVIKKEFHKYATAQAKVTKQ